MSLLTQEKPSRFRKDLRELDPESQEYWDEVLRREDLSMSQGSTPRVQYYGTPTDLESVEKAYVARLACGTGGGRKVKAKGSKPE